MARKRKEDVGKLPGKAQWAGRRRPRTRESGFNVRGPGGEIEIVDVDGFELKKGATLVVKMTLPAGKSGSILGFGGWFAATDGIDVTLEGFPGKHVLLHPDWPNWGKFGSQWFVDTSKPSEVRLVFRATKKGRVALWEPLCGSVAHEHLAAARPELMGNMHDYAPEANFIDPADQGDVSLKGGTKSSGVARIALKSCNRCARFLPVNLDNERVQLSYTNHCVATHRRPCRHSGFGRLTEVATGNEILLEYGFQLECRFCKKFEVNAALNPLRTVAQMKEDGQRRRALEFLTEHLYEGTPQLRYRHAAGGELSDFVYKNFGGRCFKCGTALASSSDMRLDHTRPLALLWPLDGTATALCTTCNSRKRDRPPVDFYTDDELVRLAKKTRIPLKELRDPSPNIEAIALLQANLDWFCKEFLRLPELRKERDGKIAGDLLVKALQKTLNKHPKGAPFDLQKECKKRGR